MHDELFKEVAQGIVAKMGSDIEWKDGFESTDDDLDPLAFLLGLRHHRRNNDELKLHPFTPNPRAEALIAATGARIADSLVGALRGYPVPDGPAYNTDLDLVVMPQRERYESEEIYYRSIFHELGHWTMNRVGRQVHQTRRGRAREELVAELTSAFITATLGYTDTDRAAAYLTNHYKGGFCEPSDLLIAAQQARQAAYYILNAAAQDVKLAA